MCKYIYITQNNSTTDNNNGDDVSHLKKKEEESEAEERYRKQRVDPTTKANECKRNRTKKKLRRK